MLAVIMSGGSGKRFWPLSKSIKPKQYIKLFEEKSLIQLTYERLKKKISPNDIYFITTPQQSILIKEQIPEVSEGNIFVEPYGKNTALCILYSLKLIMDIHKEDEKMFFLPADHYVGKEDIMMSLVQRLDKEDNLDISLLGIKPEHPATGYGYIECGHEICNGMFHVKQFKEKPDIETARKYLNQGNFLWNSGMFIGKASVFLSAFQEFMPVEFDRLVLKNVVVEEVYSMVESLPFDTAVLEKCKNTRVIEVDIDWCDVGSWKSLSSLYEKKCLASPKQIDYYGKNNFSLTEKKVVFLDLEDLFLIESNDSILVAPKESSEKVKNLVDFLASEHPDLL